MTIERPLGVSSHLFVKPIGLGCMPLSIRGRPSETNAKKVIMAALEAGVNFLDTADVYCLDDKDIGHNERLIASVLKEKTEAKVVVATKGGMIRPRGSWEVDGRPEHLRKACNASLKSLNRECIDLYYLHAPDDNVPFKESVETLAELKKLGKIKNVGISNVSKKQITEAQNIVDIAAVQNRCNPFDLSSFENGVVRYCEEFGIAFVAYSPVAGSNKSKIAHHPVLNKIGKAHGKSPFQAALAWLLSKSSNLIAIPGSSHVQNIQNSADSLNLQLTTEEIKSLDDTFSFRA